MNVKTIIKHQVTWNSPHTRRSITQHI